jgi:hypothetical protein
VRVCFFLQPLKPRWRMLRLLSWFFFLMIGTLSP